MKQQIFVQPSTKVQIVTIDIPELLAYTVTTEPSVSTTTTKAPSTTTTTTKAVITTTTTVVQNPSSYLNLPKSTPLNLSGVSNKVYENMRFEDTSATGSTLTNCSNITFRNCFFNRTAQEAISLEKCTNILVEKCLFAYNFSAVYALSSSNIRVIDCQGINSRLRPQGGRGQLVQFNGVSGGEIINNRSEAFAGESNTEDHISLFNSSNITVRGNILKGGGPSASGSGIMTGDNGGTNQLIENNILHTTGNAGIGIAGGSNIRVLNNKIYSPRTAVSNNPLYMWAQSGAACSNNTITGNFVNWIDKNGARNNGWNAGNCSSSVYNPSENKMISEAELGLPSQIITFLSPAELARVRAKQ